MTCRSIAIHTAFSCLLWPAGTVLILIGFVSDHEFGQLGILLAMIAAVLNVRGFFSALLERERNAFELGREVGERVAGVRPLR